MYKLKNLIKAIPFQVRIITDCENSELTYQSAGVIPTIRAEWHFADLREAVIETFASLGESERN